ncbi:P63C domain-containing protein [Aliarcobacter butzleri]|uniref:P63C domain-containing protein n=1 Tax=Aliarcobacter butzleri TaxID=28197 RepID=UPI00344B404A
MDKILHATHSGVLRINDIELNVAVLEDGTRIITHSAVFMALGREARGNARVIGIPAFMDAKNLQPLISSELKEVINKIEYIDINGKNQSGFNADILPLVSDLYLKAREQGKIKLRNQLETAYKAEILVRALAKVGITALVDEATGYQYDRERFELEKILNAYISDEIVKWQITFTDEFYKEIFRLWNLPFIPKNIRIKPSFIGKLTTKYVYDMLPDGVVEKIREITPKTEKGNWKYKFHQSLSPEIGREHLKKQIIETTMIMKMSKNKEEFIKHFNDMYPKSISLEVDSGYED